MDDGNEKPDVVAVSVDPNFATYYHKEFLPVVLNKKESSSILLQRYDNYIMFVCKFLEVCINTCLCIRGGGW